MPDNFCFVNLITRWRFTPRAVIFWPYFRFLKILFSKSWSIQKISRSIMLPQVRQLDKAPKIENQKWVTNNKAKKVWIWNSNQLYKQKFLNYKTLSGWPKQHIKMMTSHQISHSYHQNWRIYRYVKNSLKSAIFGL